MPVYKLTTTFSGYVRGTQEVLVVADSIESAKANWEGGELLEKVIIRDDTQNEIYGEPVFHSL